MRVRPSTRALPALVLAMGLALVAVPVLAAAPSPAWTKQFGSAENEEATAVAVDGADRIYVVGYTEGSLAGTSKGSTDVFVRKYKPDGKKAWTKQFGSASDDFGMDVAVAGSGHAYVVGYTFGSVTGWPSRGAIDAFVRKYKPDGKKVWTKQFGTSGSDEARGVAVDRSGNVYVAGSLGTGGGDAFVRKYKPNGKKVWTRQFGTAKHDSATGVAVDRSGNVYVVGYTEGSLAGTSKGSYDVFVRKYKPDGRKAWTRQFGTASFDIVNGVAVDRLGRVYVAGSTRGSLAGTSKGFADAFVRKYKPNGATPWTRQFGTGDGDHAKGVAVDRLGRVYVAGQTNGSLAGTSKGSYDVFVRKYRSDGSTAWTSQFGSAQDDPAYGAAVDSGRRAIVAGSTEGSITGWPSSGNYDAFVRVYKR